MATIKQAASGLLQSVVTIASASSNLVETTASSVDLLGNFINKCKDEQSVTYKYEADKFRKELIQTASMDQTKRELDLKQFAETSEFHADRLTANLEYYTKLLG